MIIVQCMAKMELGGAQKRVIELLRETGERGYLITGKGGKLYNSVREEFSDRCITLKHLKRAIDPFHDILCLLELKKTLIKLHRKNETLILHTHGSKAGVLGRIVSGMLPFCYSVHTVHGFAMNPYIPFLRRFLYLNAERVASRFGDIIITQAEVHIGKAKRWGIGRGCEFIHITNAINPYEFECKYKKSDKELLIGTVGNFKAQKNPILWAKVAMKITSIFNNVSFVYIGDGPLKKKVESIVMKNQRIKLTGWRNDISSLLGDMDIFFLPSRWEGLPRTVLEAMATSLPVVASSVDGTPEVVLDGKTGFLLEPDDFGGYIEKISLLIDDRNLRMEMGKNGRQRVRKYFNYKDMIKKTLSVYNNIEMI